MIINRKIKRTILESKSAYLGSLILIILSCLLYTMLNQLSNNMLNMTSSFEKNHVLEDASFVTGSKLEDISGLESRFNALIEEGGSFDYTVSGDKTIRVFSRNEKVNTPAIIKGNDITGENDILLDPAFAKANGLDTGDEIKIVDNSYKVAGFMSLPNYIYPLKSENDLMSDPKTFGIAVISKESFDKIDRGSRFYSIKFNGQSTSEDLQASAFRDYLKSENIIITGWSDTSENKRVAFVTSKIDSISKVSSTLPVAILLLTCILTGIVIWRLLRRESVVIGTLYAQGYRKNEIKRHYLIFPLVISLAGGIIGTILGALLLKPMLDFMVEYFNIPVTALMFNVKYVAVSLLLPVLFLCISGYFVLSRELRYSPVELMKGGREKGSINIIERSLKLDQLKFSTKFKIRGQLRSFSRLVFLMLGVVLATMLLLLGFTAKSSIDYLMKDSLRNTFKFEYEYVYNSLHNEQPPAGAEAFSVSLFSLKSDSKANFEVCGMNSASKYISLKDKSGAQLNVDKVIITRPLAERLNVKAGDTIKVVHKLDSREYSITIASVAQTYAGEYIFMPLTQFNDMLGYPAGTYIGLWSTEKLDIPEKQLYSSQTFNDSIKAFNASTQPLQKTIGVIALLSFVIGLIVIFVVISLIIEENRGNISLMKIFGYRRKEVNSLILNSSTALIVIGYIIGIPLILASMKMFFKAMSESLNLSLPVTISYPYAVIGFVFIYLAYALSKALSRKKVDRISMHEALKAE